MKPQIRSPLKIAIAYFIFSFLWILFSDSIVNFFVDDIDTLSTIQTLKGWFFISMTSLLIYLMTEGFFRKEEKLREEIENIFNNSATPIALISSDEEVLKINKVWQELTGYGLNEIKNLENLSKTLIKEDSQDFYTQIKDCFKINRKTNIGIFSVFTKQEEELFWNFDISILHKIKDKTVLIISVVDVTELTKKENLLIQQSKMATMGEMLENIAHQWKQPISVITMANSLLKLESENKGITTQDKIDEAIDNIEYSVQNLNETVDDFRNFFNPKKQKKEFSLEKVFDKTFKLIESQFRNNNIVLIKEIEDTKLYSYENELLQVLINIIKNAKEELQKKPPESKKVVFIKTYQKDNYLYIEIKDNAGGIQTEHLNKVFNEHFTTKEKKGGSGIGLYMSRQIIQEHMGGKMKVKNTTYGYEGETCTGALFSISLPKT